LAARRPASVVQPALVEERLPFAGGVGGRRAGACIEACGSASRAVTRSGGDVEALTASLRKVLVF